MTRQQITTEDVQRLVEEGAEMGREFAARIRRRRDVRTLLESEPIVTSEPLCPRCARRRCVWHATGKCSIEAITTADELAHLRARRLLCATQSPERCLEVTP